MDRALTIGQLAAAAQVSADTIRYYESVGLMPPPARSPAGYRLYPHTAIRRLHLIRQAKLLGMSLATAKEFVDRTFTDTCAHLQRALLDQIPVQLAGVERRIAELEALRGELLAMQASLQRLDGTLPADPVVDCARCPCIDALEGR